MIGDEDIPAKAKAKDNSHFAKGFDAACKLFDTADSKALRNKHDTLRKYTEKDQSVTRALARYREQFGAVDNISNFIEWAMTNRLLPQQDANTWRIHLRLHFAARGQPGRPRRQP